jgi:hypothetical protein
MFEDQLRTAFLISWLVVSTLVFAVLLAPFLLPPQAIFDLAPACENRIRYGRECPFCGMTTSFVFISRGRLNAAARQNKAAIPLYSALVWNECVAIWYTLGEVRRMWRPARRSRIARTEETSCRS